MKCDGTDPRRTIQLLNSLERVGFSDAAFKILHHKHEPISVHCEWCRKKRISPLKPFRHGLLDWQVQRRLEFVLREYSILASNDLENEVAIEVFRRLAEASLVLIPRKSQKE